MDPERQREIASEGGRASHESGNAHEFTSDEARAAGRRGAEASHGGGNQGGGNQGGSHEQHVEAGRQSHKNSGGDGGGSSASSGTQGGSHE